ncbi:hypothetical protein SCMC78_09030 [Streptomyces sp. CMC78]|uniref:Ig-like domain-containing protein n=1 Tax=Streptomyces sp. CMC78 TaxID=3231512 RepID=A0AB33K6J8_9ACTN
MTDEDATGRTGGRPPVTASVRVHNEAPRSLVARIESVPPRGRTSRPVLVCGTTPTDQHDTRHTTRRKEEDAWQR